MTTIINDNKTPSIQECYEIISSCKMLPNIIKHSEQVMRVALTIYNSIKSGIQLNKELIIAASLLHDIKKTESLSTKEPHDIKGGEFLRKLGYEELAVIIEEHVIIKDFDSYGSLLEKEIVFYADKRVMHDKIVSVEKRITDIIARYGKTRKRINKIMKNKKIILKVENKIKKHLKINIEDAINSIN